MTGASIDRNVIERRLLHLLRYVDVLREYQGLSLDELTASPKVHWAVQHGLQLCIQAVVDISAHIVVSLGAVVHDQYRSHIVALGKLGILPPSFAERIADMAGFRNVLVHEYVDVDLREVHRVLVNNLEDFERFAAYIQTYLEGHAV